MAKGQSASFARLEILGKLTARNYSTTCLRGYTCSHELIRRFYTATYMFMISSDVVPLTSLSQSRTKRATDRRNVVFFRSNWRGFLVRLIGGLGRTKILACSPKNQSGHLPGPSRLRLIIGAENFRRCPDYIFAVVSHPSHPYCPSLSQSACSVGRDSSPVFRLTVIQVTYYL